MSLPALNFKEKFSKYEGLAFHTSKIFLKNPQLNVAKLSVKFNENFYMSLSSEISSYNSDHFQQDTKEF